jgi:hypothetical protein
MYIQYAVLVHEATTCVDTAAMLVPNQQESRMGIGSQNTVLEVVGREEVGEMFSRDWRGWNGC